MKKKVLFVINTMGRAGAERCLIHLLNAWKDDAYELSLFSVLGRGELFREVPSHVRILNQAPESSTVFDSRARKGIMKDLLKGLWEKKIFFCELVPMLKLLLWQIKEKKVDVKKLCWKPASDTAPVTGEEFDLAVGYLQGAATYYVMDHVKARKKVVFLHNDYEASGYCARWDRPYYEKADKIYCVSDFIGAGLKEIFPACKDKIETFYNFADALWVKDKAKEGNLREDGTPKDMKKEPGTICLLTAARLEYVKAFDVAIRTMALLKQKGVKARWYVLGDGSLQRELEREIRKQGVADSFFLLGAKENPYPYMAACDIYLQETRFEGFCTSITEAVILGRKVVASDCGSNREQLAFYGTGVITKLNPQAIAEGIERAWREEQPKVDVMERQKEELERLKREI
ncbi:MAG: glycosyltransferase [Lachnospiraceae bacterium]|nr:glycosyltransferase [Lachnospiraceae bacterium]